MCKLHLLLIAREYKLCEWFQVIDLNWAGECDSLIVGENWRAGLLCCKCCKWSSWELETACESQKTKLHWCCHHCATQLTHDSFDCCWWLGSTEVNVGRTPQRVVQNVHRSDPCQIGAGLVSPLLAGVIPKQGFLVTLHSKDLAQHTSRIFLVNCLHRRLLLPVT